MRLQNYSPRLSNCRFRKSADERGRLGFLSFDLDGFYHIGDVALYQRLKGGLRLLYPTRKLKNGFLVPTFHPLSKEIDQLIIQQVDCFLKRSSEKLIFEEKYDKNIESHF